MTTYQNEKAFPFSRKEYVIVEDAINDVEVSCDGMDLRDYFAARALLGYYSVKEVHTAIARGDTACSNIASACYEMADAMMKARGQ